MAATVYSSPHRMVFGSHIGGMKETLEMLDYSVARKFHNLLISNQIAFLAAIYQ